MYNRFPLVLWRKYELRYENIFNISTRLFFSYQLLLTREAPFGLARPWWSVNERAKLQMELKTCTWKQRNRSKKKKKKRKNNKTWPSVLPPHDLLRTRVTWAELPWSPGIQALPSIFPSSRHKSSMLAKVHTTTTIVGILLASLSVQDLDCQACCAVVHSAPSFWWWWQPLREMLFDLPGQNGRTPGGFGVDCRRPSQVYGGTSGLIRAF